MNTSKLFITYRHSFLLTIACARRYFESKKRQENEFDNEDIKKRKRCVARRYKVTSFIIAVVVEIYFYLFIIICYLVFHTNILPFISNLNRVFKVAETNWPRHWFEKEI